MVEILEDMDGSAGMVERRDPQIMSERYYLEGDRQMQAGFILDGLVNIHLARTILTVYTLPATIG